jgi:hypothetical protein
VLTAIFGYWLELTDTRVPELELLELAELTADTVI